jgi:hypothetical protein
MDIPRRKLVRLAEVIRQQLLLLQGSRYTEVMQRTHHVAESMDRLRRDSGLLAICLSRNWYAAAGQVTERIAQNLGGLQYLAGEIERIADPSKVKPPAIRDILADLEQAQDEFESLKYVEDSDLLAVTTEDIELEGYYLGPFEIQLHIASLAEMERHNSIYGVVALDPHPATCDEAVTHPHVSGERLCEGEASAAIESALMNGRICDFFQLVNAVLTNYNPSSPYVALADWEGRPCYGCGHTMGTDDTHWCSHCENDFCDECVSYCRRCDETACGGCLEECSACGEPVCPSCKTTCPDCARLICRNCLDEKQCPCVQERKEQEQHQENQDEPESHDSRTPAGNGSSPVNTRGQVGTEAA